MRTSTLVSARTLSNDDIRRCSVLLLVPLRNHRERRGNDAGVNTFILYQFGSSKDHSRLCASTLLFYSPDLCVPRLKETGPWVWGLQDLSAWTKQGAAVWRERVPVCLCVFLSLLTSAPAIPVIWYQHPTVCKSIQYSLQSLGRRTGTRGA